MLAAEHVNGEWRSDKSRHMKTKEYHKYLSDSGFDETYENVIPNSQNVDVPNNDLIKGTLSGYDCCTFPRSTESDNLMYGKVHIPVEERHQQGISCMMDYFNLHENHSEKVGQVPVNDNYHENPLLRKIQTKISPREYFRQRSHHDKGRQSDLREALCDFEYSQKDKDIDGPKDVDEIMNALSEELRLDEGELISGHKREFHDNNLKKPIFQTISTFPHPSFVHQLATTDNRDVSDSNKNKQLNVSQVPEGSCGACGKIIVGQVLLALDKMWHLDHFKCHQCGIQLGTNLFYEYNGRSYCENDYINLFSPRCAACQDPVIDKCITALDKSWHSHHFLCCHCNRQLGEGVYHSVDGLPYCSHDFYNLFAPKCFGCGEALINDYITALHQQWHATCFVCFECREPFTSGSFYDHDGHPFCEQHFDILKKGMCSSCNQIIHGPFITAIGKKYHPGHFVCTFCLQTIYQETFKEHEKKPYCLQCSDRLFG